MRTPLMQLKRGVVIDRVQPQGIPPIDAMRVLPQDMAVIRRLSFDHVKVLITPSAIMAGDALDYGKLWYVEEVVGLAVDAGIPCLLCIHPEAPFKRDHLGSAERFAAVQSFYADLCTWLAGKWNASQLAFQIMTEPFANYTNWNQMHAVLWRTVRKCMPEHTLVLSGDRTGSFFALLDLAPVDDDNVYYGYTSYDPFAFTLQSWNAFFGGVDASLDSVGHMPYPASPAIVEAAMADILSTVPPCAQSEAMKYARRYGKGDYQQGNQGVFDRQWMQARMCQIDAWRDKAGRNLPVLCNEFGVMDAVMGGKYGGPGCRAQDRHAFLRDIRETMEAHGVGWSYWSFNETFTIFDPERRAPFGHDGEELLDEALLDALGITRTSAR